MTSTIAQASATGPDPIAADGDTAPTGGRTATRRTIRRVRRAESSGAAIPPDTIATDGVRSTPVTPDETTPDPATPDDARSGAAARRTGGAGGTSRSAAWRAVLRDDTGMSTVEYAIGTVAAAAFAAILYAVVSGDNVVDALTGIVQRALSTTF